MKKTKIDFRQLAKRYQIYLLLIAMIIVASVASKDFRSVQNITNLFSQSSIVGIMAIGQTMVLLTGGFDLSQGSYVALVSVLLAISMSYGVLPAVLIMVVCLLFLGLFNGFFVNRGITPFVVTLGMQGIARTLALWLSGADAVSLNNSRFFALAYGSLLGIPVPTLIWIGMSLFFAYVLNFTSIGRHIYAVGGDKESARLSGVNIKRVMYFVFFISAFCCAMAGAIYTSKLGVALPDKAVGYEMDAIASSVIGGTSLSGGVGTLGGTFAGVLIYAIITNVLNIVGVSPYWQQVVKGVIILAAVYSTSRSLIKRKGGQSNVAVKKTA